MACDSGGDPNVISGLVAGLPSRKEFRKLSRGKSILRIDGRKVFCVRADDKMTAGCVAEIEQKRERMLFSALYRVLELPEVQHRPVQGGAALERRLDLEARSLEREKKDIVEKNQMAVTQASGKVEDMLKKEYDKHRKLLEVEEEVREIEVVTGENQAMATEIKYRSIWEDMKMNALLLGGAAVVVLFLIFVATRLIPF